MHRRRGPERSAALFSFTFTRTESAYGNRRRPHLRHHAARRRAGPRQQPDSPRRSSDLPGSSTRSAWTSSRRASRPRPRATTGACARSRPRSGARSSPRWRAATSGDIDLAGEAIERRGARPAPRLRLHLRPAHPGEAAPHAGRGARAWPAQRCAGRGSTPTTSSSPPRTPAAPTPTSSAGWWRRPSRRGPPTINLPDTVGYAHAGRVRRDVPRRARAGARERTGSSSAPTATTTWASPSPTRWPRSRAGRAAGGVHRERHRRAGRATPRSRRS